MEARAIFPKKNYPFSDELCDFMDREQDFYGSLKISQPERFVFVPIIFTSHTPASHPLEKDEVIGMWYFDKEDAKFKQDFIVNKNSESEIFISYTAKWVVEKFCSKYVQEIDNFFSEYGNNKSYYHDGNKWQHHYDNISDLPDEPSLKLLAQQLVNNF